MRGSLWLAMGTAANKWWIDREGGTFLSFDVSRNKVKGILIPFSVKTAVKHGMVFFIVREQWVCLKQPAIGKENRLQQV